MVPGRLTILLLAVFTIGMAPGRLEAQETGAGRSTGYRGVALKSYLLKTRPWTITEYTEFGPSIRTAEGGAAGLGLNLSYALHPSFAIFAAADMSLYGDISGYIIYSAGAEYRLPLTERLIMAVNGGIGRFGESSNTTFNVASFDGGLEFFIFRRLALGAGVQLWRALGAGIREYRFEPSIDHPPVKATLDGTLARTRYGLHWYLGRRNE
jgi:hypothetical protein